MRAVARVIGIWVAVSVLAAVPARAQQADGLPTAPVTPADTRWAARPLQVGLASAFIALQSLDTMTTLRALQQPQNREANPMMAPFAAHPLAFVGVKAAGTATTLWLVRHLAQSRPRTAAVVLFAANTAIGFVVASNISHLDGAHHGR